MRKLLVCLVACSLVHAADIRAALQPTAERKAAPDYVLVDASDKRVSLANFSGKALFWDLWATKCGGCVKEIPSFIDIHHAHAANRLAVVGISMDIL